MNVPDAPDDRTLALRELSRDIFFHKIPRERLDDFINLPLSVGRAAAKRYSGAGIGDLYRERGIALVRRADGTRFGVTLRGLATMSAKVRKVEVYESSIRELADGAGMDFELALRVHLAHEFFHFLEFDGEFRVVEALGRVESFRFLGFVRRVHIHAASEVAAHAFAKGFAGLPCLPNHFDSLYLMRRGTL